MKNILNIKNIKILNKNEQKSIAGGLVGITPVSCTAYCGEDVPTVTCTGVGCSATDYDGCTGDSGNKACPPVA